jgi:ABC-type cobalamin/Fe3+-siderophores transport system ATPase subunit
MSGGDLSLSGVQVRRGGRTILDIGRLDISAGSFVGIMGPNGAGKTTLLQVLTGLIDPGVGCVTVDGEDLSQLCAWRKCHLRQRIGYIPQATQYNADLPFTLREVVAMGRTSVRPLLKPLNREDGDVVDAWVEKVGLSDRRDQTFRSLSGGQQQKALIARAMAQNPDILMLDEPCANLDFIWKEQISGMIDDLYRQTHVTVVMVSHEIGVFPSACERLIVLGRGRVVADGTPHDVQCAGMLRRTFEVG